ncbi:MULTISPECIES: 30S ribosomal protein S6 [unclassified Prochlorococcus]|uniref:30S ribosomal protein S6 n=1 Tax=unclassified Prochlorococcus TaxID=2627481 RepID=UPI0005336FF9|nr:MULTISPECIES: 30S ribosomal protein S6 [unclassified Prochlorococcus]KGG14508.1 SSU ribosomal protein S6p [Prochlorococcus sp. MIT 0602]KGG16067.1 SSU ribosomal protein S6p [Prochlorococcus sp. MIT 0603]
MTNPTYYETMYILRPDIPEDEVDGHLKKYSELLEKANVKIIDNQMRGKRRLAYTIGKNREGIYVQLSHIGDGKHVEILEKAMRLSEDVIRYLTVKQYGPIPTKRSTKTAEKEDDKSNENEDAKDKVIKKDENKEEKKVESKEEKKVESKEEKKEESNANPTDSNESKTSE